MTQIIADFRSDTVTRPSAGMRLVTHLDIDQQGIDHMIEACTDFFR